MTASTSSAAKAKLTPQDLGITPILTLPTGVRMLNADEYGTCQTYCLHKDAKYSEKEISRCSQVLQFLGTEYVTAHQWDIVTAVLPCGLGAQRPVKRVWENRTNKAGLFRIPIEILPKDIVRTVMAAKKVLVRDAAEATKAAAKAAKANPEPKKDAAKVAGPAKAKKVKTEKTAKVKSAAVVAMAIDNDNEADLILDAQDNDGVGVPVELLMAAD